MKEQFAGWGMYDNSAICLDCLHQHLIPKAEQVTAQPWLDWQTKHKGHEVFIIPEKLLSKLANSPRLQHNADVKIAYAASAAYTITLASLATSSTLLVGRESTAVSNTTNKYLDELVAGLITTGTTPTVSTNIEVHCIGALNDTPLYPDVFDGTDSAETITSANVKAGIVVPIANLVVTATSNIGYYFLPVGIRRFFGDAMPPAHVLFVTHNTAVNLNSTGGNQAIYHTPVYNTVT